MRIPRLLLLATVFAGIGAAPASAQGDRPSKAAWFCSSMPTENPVYVSAVWEKAEIQDLIVQDFKRFLTAKYGYAGATMCGGASSTQNANALAVEQTTKAQQIAAWQKAGMKIVETGWDGNQPKTGPPPAVWSACSATILAAGGRQNQGPFETYVSAPFDGGETTVQAQQAAFEHFLRAKYAITTTDLHPQCLALGDEAGAQRAIGMWTKNGSVNGKAFDTGWKMGM